MDTLKALNFIPPMVALVIVGGWVTSQRNIISSLEDETIVLQKRLAARLAGTDAGPALGKPAAPGKAAKESEPIDWKKLAGQIQGMQRGGDMGDMRAMLKLQKQVMSMSRDELSAALKEIGALDLPDDARAMLEGMLVEPLVQKDPEFALTAFADRLSDDRGGMSWRLSTAMKEWLKKDPVAATAWFDQQIAAGKFDSKALDGKNRTRMQFEGEFVSSLISSDPAAAGARLAGLPVDQRAEVLGNYSGDVMKDENQAAYAGLVRSQVPEKDQARALAQTASRLMWGGDGYEKVTAYMDRIDASPAERAACVEQSADSKIQMLSRNEKITRETIDSMREWATAQAPDAADNITGKTLANATRGDHKLEFSEAADLAVKYRDSTGNDEVLVGFLESGAAFRNKEKARELAASIADEKRRNEILQRFQ